MTDERARELVEALRELAWSRETYSIEAGQAADEIERLRAEVRTLNASGGLMIGEQRLEEIEARANAATPGPWRTTDGSPGLGWVDGPTEIGYDGELVLADAVFIAHARQDVPELVAEVKRLRQWLRLDTVFGGGLSAMTAVELKDALGAVIEEHGLNSNGVVVTTCLLDDGRLLLEVEGEADGQKLANGRLFPPTDICRHCAIVTMMGLIDSVREAMCSTKTAPN